MTFKNMLTMPLKIETDNYARLLDLLDSPNHFGIKYIKFKFRASDSEYLGQLGSTTQLFHEDGLLDTTGIEIIEKLPELTLKVDTAFSNTHKKMFYLPKEVYEIFETIGLRLPMSSEEARFSEEITKEYAKHMNPVMSLMELLDFSLKTNGRVMTLSDFGIDLINANVNYAICNKHGKSELVNSDQFSLTTIDLSEKTINLDQVEMNQDTALRRSV